MRIFRQRKLQDGADETIFEHEQEGDGYRGVPKVNYSRLTVKLQQVLPNTLWNRIKIRIWPNDFVIRDS